MIQSPLLLGAGIVALFLTLLAAALAALMRRAGQPLRGLVFVYIFIGLIVLPQVAYHAAVAVGWLTEPSSGRQEAGLDSALARTPGTATLQPHALVLAGEEFAEPARVFGSDVDPTLVRDARAVFGDALAGATVARIAFFMSGETVVAAIFPSSDAAGDAAIRYLRFMGIDRPQARFDGLVTLRRAGAPLVRLLHADSALFAWSAADDATLDRRLASMGALTFTPASVAGASVDGAPRSGSRREPVQLGWPVFAAFLVTQTLLVSLWFFKGSAWAATRPPAPGVQAVSAAELRDRLHAINARAVPFAVSDGREPGTLEVTWRYADARWIDHMRAHGMRRLHRFVLVLDESSRSVRVREYQSAFDWSAGGGGASISWKLSRGITFFEYRRERVFGLQLDDRGHPTASLSYEYVFDFEEMRRPVVDIVTAAGWRWRPLVWDAPPWLRWATE